MKIHREMKLSKAVVMAVALASLCACKSVGSGSGATGVGSGTSGCATNPACKVESIDSVAYGAGIYVAGGMGGLGSGDGNTIGPWMETSTDGVSWKVINSGDSTLHGDFASITYGPKGFVALDSSSLYFSADGKLWEDVTPKGLPKGALTLFSVDWDGSEYIAYDGTPSYESHDGRTWTPFPTPFPSAGPTQIRKLPSAYYALWIGSAADLFATSPDLATWTPYTETFAGFAPGTISPSQMIYAGGQLVVVGSGGFIATSSDGTIWTSDATGDASDNFLQVAYNGSVYVAIGNCGSVDTSADGTAWTKVDVTGLVTSNGGCPTAVTAAPGGAFVVVSGIQGLTSMDGIHWRAIKF